MVASPDHLAVVEHADFGTDGDWLTPICDALLSDQTLKRAELEHVLSVYREQAGRKSFVSLLVQLGLVSAANLAATLSNVMNIVLITGAEMLQMDIQPEPISFRFLREHGVLPIRDAEDSLLLVMVDPTNAYAINAIRLVSKGDVRLAIGLPDDVQKLVDLVYGHGQSEMDQIAGGENTEDQNMDLDVSRLRDMASEAPVIRVVNHLLQKAKEFSASDIHIEPFERTLKVRYRIDGVLKPVDPPPAHLAAAIVSRVKIMSNLDIAERRLPQDGRVKIRLNGQMLDIRVSTVPTLYGESVVMRLLDRSDVQLDVEKLGFAPAEKKLLINALNQPHGLILVTGPTGSGKTTTLYSALNMLNTADRKIITAEDPVEYQMEGVNQIQVQPGIGLTFANVLRSIVRQDPDVILVGETRDLETARICIQSALTGHLVLSTVHTNSAAGSITRLLDMGVEDYLLSSTLTAIIGQRLVRVLCKACRQKVKAAPEFLERFDVAPRDGAEICLFEPSGCAECSGTGYRGRTSIQEILTPDDQIRKAMLTRADVGKFEAIAVDSGMKTLFRDGIEKALSGITSVQEVMRVAREDE